MSSRVLLYKGERVKIQDQPLQILLSLLQTPGELVSRETLWKQLWPEKNAEDSDRSLRVAATKLRHALSVNATAPKLIDMIPKRGYQFIGEVNLIPLPPVPSVSLALISASSPEQLTVPAYRQGHLRSYLYAISIALLAVVLAGIGLYWTHLAHGRVAFDPSALVVVSGVMNATGNRELDGVLTPAIQAKLEESPYINLASEESFRRLVRDPDTSSLQGMLKICSTLHAGEIVGGELTSANPGYTLKLNAWRCPDGRLLASRAATVHSQAEILAALDNLTGQMRRLLGEPQTSLQKFDVPVSQAMTASLGALRAFTQGERKHLTGSDLVSIEDYNLAVALDSRFAFAYARLGTAYSDVGEYTAAAQAYRKAFELRDRTTERGRFYITSHYFSSTGELEMAVKALQLWREMYPRDPVAANNLSNMYEYLGEPQKAWEQAEAAIQLDPNMDYAYIQLAWADMRTGRFTDLNRLCGNSPPAVAKSMGLRVACFQGDFAQGNEAAMQQELEKAKDDRGEGPLLASTAWIAMYRGQLHQAERSFSVAEASARANHLDEVASELSLDEASLEADLGSPVTARRLALQSLKASPESPNVQAFSALLMARTGDFALAERIAAKVSAQQPGNTILNDVVLASAQAAESMGKGMNNQAIRQLESARPYDFSSDMEFAPAYYRGLAFLQDRQWNQAIGEFHRVLSQRVSLPASPYLPLSQLELGRALQLSGQTADAEQAYREVGEIWKSADVDFAPLQRLKAYRSELSAASRSRCTSDCPVREGPIQPAP